jgi:6-phosphogluconolactonase
VLTGPRDPERLPAQLIRPSNGKLLFLLDEAAAAKLPAASEVSEGAGHRVGVLEI